MEQMASEISGTANALCTKDALHLLGCTHNTFIKHAKNLSIRSLVGIGKNNTKYWYKVDVELIRAELLKNPKAHIRAFSKAGIEEAKQSFALDIPDEEDSGDGNTPSPIPPALSVKKASQALRARIAKLIHEKRVIETLVADLTNLDWKARQGAANILLSKVLPNLKSTEVTHAQDEEVTERQEKALQLLEEIKKAGIMSLPQPVHPQLIILEDQKETPYAS